MIYSLLTFRQKGSELVYLEDSSDGTDRQYKKPYIKGCPGMAFVYCPRGKEKEWKKKLIRYLKKELSDQIEMNNLLLNSLDFYL